LKTAALLLGNPFEEDALAHADVDPDAEYRKAIALDEIVNPLPIFAVGKQEFRDGVRAVKNIPCDCCPNLC
jgi:hypothetical protein